MITKEQFIEWKEHPVTKEIFAGIKEIRTDLSLRMSMGDTLGQRADVTHGMTHRLVGHIEGLNQLLEISFIDNEDINKISDITGH